MSGCLDLRRKKEERKNESISCCHSSLQQELERGETGSWWRREMMMRRDDDHERRCTHQNQPVFSSDHGDHQWLCHSETKWVFGENRQKFSNSRKRHMNLDGEEEEEEEGEEDDVRVTWAHPSLMWIGKVITRLDFEKISSIGTSPDWRSWCSSIASERLKAAVERNEMRWSGVWISSNKKERTSVEEDSYHRQ